MTKDWSNAMKWDSKHHRIIHVFKNKNTWITSDIHQIIDRAQCKEFLNYRQNCIETNFDIWIHKSTEFKVIHFNNEEWELSAVVGGGACSYNYASM